MKITELLKVINCDAIVGVDFETFFDDAYTLKNQSTSEYVYDKRFMAYMASVQYHTDRKADVIACEDFKRWATGINWSRTALLAHHAHFDGLILSKHFKINPCFILDTMSMGRALLPVTVGDSLQAMCLAFGLDGKQGGEVLAETKGKRKLNLAEYKKMAKYAGTDIEQTWKLFWKLLPFIPPNELHVIDITVKMFTAPLVVIDTAAANQVVIDEVARKAALVAQQRATPLQLGSSTQFAELLRGVGVDPPMKVSPTKAKRLQLGETPKWPDDFTYAFAMGDLEFKELLKHPDKNVRQLVEARVAVKSNNLESKATKMAERSLLGAVPMYLKYSGAKTHRWSGSDSINWQNMNRGSDIRKAIKAPHGYIFIIADQSQIEARLNAWYCGQLNIVEAFANKQDVYVMAAAHIYGKPIDRITKDERFVGKTGVLGLGYQAGAPRFGDMLRIGQFGPPVFITDAAAKDIVTGWRQANHMIVAGWKETQNLVKSAFIGKQRVEHKCGIVYEGVRGKDVGYIHHMPTGLSMRYDGLKVSGDRGDLSYISEYFKGKKGGVRIEYTKLYGGILTENRTQFLARQILAEQMVQTKLQVPKAWKLRHVMTTHDEVLVCVLDKYADKALDFVKRQMLTPPTWCEGLPFGVDAALNKVYDKA